MYKKGSMACLLQRCLNFERVEPLLRAMLITPFFAEESTAQYGRYLEPVFFQNVGERYFVVSHFPLRAAHFSDFGSPPSVSVTAAVDEKVTTLDSDEAIDVLHNLEVDITVAVSKKSLAKSVCNNDRVKPCLATRGKTSL